MDWHPRRLADGVFWVGSEDGLNRFVPPGVAADVRRLTSRTRKPKTEMLNDQSLLTSAATKKGPEPFFTFTTRQVIMLTVEEDIEQVFESLKAGATGYLVKHVAPEEILEAVAQVHRGGAPMSSHIARMVVTTFRHTPADVASDLRLSPREEEVLRLLAKGHRSKEIADELGIGVGTVNTYVR